MEINFQFNQFNIKEEIEPTLVKILMLQGEKGDTGGVTDYNDLSNKPTKLSDFTNDGVFITNVVDNLTNYYKKSETYTQSEIDNMISTIPKFDIEVVNQLPTTDISTTTVYLVPSATEGEGIYKEYIYVNNSWELLGSQRVDLTDYYNKTETNSLLSNKVDKVTGKGLSTEDYTSAEKTKLSNIESEANKTVVVQATGSSTTSVMSQDAVTNQLNAKATTTVYTATLTSGGWSSSAPYTQTVNISGILATDNPIVDVVLDANTSTAMSQISAWVCVSKIVTSNGSITATCLENKPITNISIQLKVVR